MYRTLPVARCPTPLKEAPTPTKYSNAKRVLSLSRSPTTGKLGDPPCFLFDSNVLLSSVLLLSLSLLFH